MSIREMIMNIVGAESRTATGELRKKLPTWTMYQLDVALIKADNTDGLNLFSYDSVRARISELVSDGFLMHDGATPRNYSLRVFPALSVT